MRMIHALVFVTCFENERKIAGVVFASIYIDKKWRIWLAFKNADEQQEMPESNNNSDIEAARSVDNAHVAAMEQ